MWTLSCFADEIAADPREQFSVLNRLSIGWVELRSAWGVNVLDLDDSQLDDVRSGLREHGLRVSSIGSPIGKVGVRDDFDEHLLRVDRALDVAAFLEAPYVRVFSFYVPEGEDPARHRDAVLWRLGAIVRRAEQRDVVLLHENEKLIYGDVPARCLDIVEAIGSPKLRLVWDPANFVQVGVRPFTEGYELLRPHVGYLHVKDALLASGEVVPAGEGDGEVRQTLHALREDRFDGFFSLEPHLAESSSMGGFTGEQLFGVAHTAFTRLLKLEGVAYR